MIVSRISIHAPREGGDCQFFSQIHVLFISIHAPREGGDFHDDLIRYTDYISIHAPREGGDYGSHFPWRSFRISIHAPREGGDRGGSDAGSILKHFNPRPPRGGRLVNFFHKSMYFLFQSTPPARGATLDAGALALQLGISIHAPREGGDFGTADLYRRAFDFNPRPPRGGRPYAATSSTVGGVFQSTPPARGATFRVFLLVI